MVVCYFDSEHFYKCQVCTLKEVISNLERDLQHVNLRLTLEQRKTRHYKMVNAELENLLKHTTDDLWDAW